MRLAQFLCCCVENPVEQVTKSFTLAAKKDETRALFDKVKHIKKFKELVNPDGTLKKESTVDKKEHDLQEDTKGENNQENRHSLQGLSQQREKNIEEGAKKDDIKLTRAQILKRQWDYEMNAPIDDLASYRNLDNEISAAHQVDRSEINGSKTLNKRGYHTKCHSTAQPGLAKGGLKSTAAGAAQARFKFHSPIRPKSIAIAKQERIVSLSKADTAAQTHPQPYLIGDYSPISFMESLSNVIENSQSDPIKAQLYIENSLMESEKIKLEDKSFLLTTHGQLLHKHVLEANKTLNILYQKKELKFKFPSLDEELNKLEYLLLAFSLGVTYYGRLD